MRYTPVQIQLLNIVQEKGSVRSLRHMTDDLGIDYSHAHSCIVRLERDGVLSVSRSPGQPLVLEVCEGFDVKGLSGFQAFQLTTSNLQGDDENG